MVSEDSSRSLTGYQDEHNLNQVHLRADEFGENEIDPFSDPEERQVIFAALDSFRQYRKQMHLNTTHRRRQNLYALSSLQWRLLSSPPFFLLDNLNRVDDAIDCNANIADEILSLGLASFGLSADPPKDGQLYWHETAKPGDMAKAHSTIRQFYRDWSAEGFQSEIKPILDAIISDLHSTISTPSEAAHPKILLPGAGLARLLFSLSLAGYAVEGNEISYHQLLASNWILNHTRRAGGFPLYPFATTFTNLRSRADQLKHVDIPDVHPATTIATSAVQAGEMSMNAGDFCVVYSSPTYSQHFDAVATVFFIDTAPNLLRYIATVRSCLRSGGVWINVGPLLWHFDGEDRTAPAGPSSSNSTSPEAEDIGIAEPGSFELTDDEVVVLLQQSGFDILTREILSDEETKDEEEEGTHNERNQDRNKVSSHNHHHRKSELELGYIQDPDSMLQNLYRVSHWVARKL